MLIFDVTNRESFKQIQHYKEMFEEENTQFNKNFFILVGTKVDLVQHRVISSEEAINLLATLPGEKNPYSYVPSN